MNRAKGSSMNAPSQTTAEDLRSKNSRPKAIPSATIAHSLMIQSRPSIDVAAFVNGNLAYGFDWNGVFVQPSLEGRAWMRDYEKAGVLGTAAVRFRFGLFDNLSVNPTVSYSLGNVYASTTPLDDPTKLGPVVQQLLSGARLNSGMDGKPGGWPQSTLKG